MKQRIITGVILAAVLIPLFYIGGVLLNMLLLLLTIGGSYELYNMFNPERKLPKITLFIELIISGGVYLTLREFYVNQINSEWLFLSIVAIIVISALLFIFINEFDDQKYGELFITTLYPSIGFGAIYATAEFGLLIIGFLFLITTVTDIFAYFIGINFGKHRLAIHISPKKSIEGSIGGTVFALIFTSAYILLFDITSIGNIQLTPIIVIGLVILLSVMGQIGDLIASKFKRASNIKDFSQIFPGHGGIMDRFDSVLFAGLVLMLINNLVGIL
ncbi:MAG: phosphatidate cytidylyltransferase [Candidatus Izimaplasma sp.]|nr:phosphatidate cytidylyltransferase [Candidatus Izimaplasma bacterium]